MSVLDAKVFVVVGAAGGVGAAVAHALAEQGAKLLLVDNGADIAGQAFDGARLEGLARELRHAPGSVHTMAVDATAPDAADSIIRHAVETLGGFDGLVYAAGIQRDASVLRMETDDFRAVLDVALVAPFAFVRAAARVMVERKSGGSVVLFTAPNALFGSARQANTASAWAGVVGLTRTAAIELRRHGIRVNAIAPTARTRINEELPLFQGVRSESLRAEHIAPVVAYLLSPRAEHVSGEVLGVAGGRVYSLRARETSGTPPDARITAENLPDFWDAITRT